jgi:hypothetical protein
MGPLNADILRQCMTEMVRRHEHLRTTVELVDGYPVQIVHPPHPISLPIAELRRDIASSAAIAEIAAEEYRKPFDFSRLPVMRFSLYRVDSNEHWLVQASHHITSDALSGRLYYEELSELYSAATGQAETNRPDPALHYGDYAVWQRELLRKDQLAYRRALTWWRRNLSETQPLKLPFARETALVDAKPADGWIKFEIKPETTRQLDALARDHSVTPYTVRLAAFLVHLASETGQFDLSLGMYVGNRHRIALQSMLGLFANLVTVRVRFDPTLAFFEWLVMVGKRVGEAEAHGELPHHLLQEAMNDTGAPLPPIEAIFSVRPSQRQFRIADIEVVAGDRTPTSGMPWGFTLALEETGDDLPCVASFDAHRYNRKGVQMFVERFSRLLDAIAYNAEGPVGVLVGQLNTEFGQSSHAPARRELKATNQHQGAISSRQFTEPRRPWRKRFRPKISAFCQYRPRKLRIPASYHADNLGAVVPSIAIVTPSYNKGRFISETIDSVLSQNYPRLNYHVQDANSSDRTTHILKSFEPRVSWHSAPDFGQAQCLNAGFKSVPGDIMSYLNSGDLLLPGTLAYVVNAFAGDKRLDFVYGHRICIDEQGQEVGRWVLPRHDRMAIKWFDFIPHETLFWRRRAWDALEGFDERCHSVFDWDFVLRAHAQGMQFARLPRFLGCLRIQDGQNTIESLTARSAESNLLRRQHLGFEPNTRKISRAAVRYWRRSMLLRKFYSLMC